MVNITDVKQILQLAIDAEIKVFLDGGWGVDALLGHQSRVHNDIDIFVEKKDYQNFIEIMKANDFYEIKMEYTTLNHNKEKNKMYKRMERAYTFGETPKAISPDEYTAWLNRAVNAKNMYLNNELSEAQALEIIRTE